MNFMQRMKISLWHIRQLHRGMNEFKKAYQLRTGLVKDEKGNLQADCPSILNGRRNYFCQLINVSGINYFNRQKEREVKPLIPESSRCAIEIAAEN
jgi:hypothetical protein